MNKGIMALLFHYGNWEIMGVASFVLQREIIALARPLKRHKYINNFLNKLRHSTGLTIIANENTGRDVIRYLKENRIVAVLGDQREKRSRGVYVEFFGEKVPTSKGIVTICMKTGTPIIPAYPVREGFLRYKIICCEPLEMERKGNIDELIHKNTRRINAFLESIIVKNPDEWFWVHRRWGRM
jgi:KDO2-lipid IV(A) lauroyltransferase